MRVRKHPLSGARYEVSDDGLVRVDDHGVTGCFTSRGEWVSGELHHVDPQLCGWLAGPQPHGKGTNPKDRAPAQGLRALSGIVRDGATQNRTAR
jgi:hypothetical protein